MRVLLLGLVSQVFFNFEIFASMKRNSFSKSQIVRVALFGSLLMIAGYEYERLFKPQIMATAITCAGLFLSWSISDFRSLHNESNSKRTADS